MDIDQSRKGSGRWFFLLLGWGTFLSCFGLAGMCQGVVGREPIKVVRDVLVLGIAEAKEGRPVHLKGVVTFYDPSIQSLFVQDATGGVYVDVGNLPMLPFREGTKVDLVGVSAPGEFSPIVMHPQIRILGQSTSLPTPVPISTEMLKTGAFDSQSVEMEGVVHSVARIGLRFIILLKTPDGYVSALSVSGLRDQFDQFVGATIRMRAVAGADYNQHRQLTGVHLFVNSSADIQVVHAAAGDGFDLPVRRIAELAKFDRNAKPMERVHLRGRATLVWPGIVMCLQDELAGICTKYTADEQFAVGMVVDAVGFAVSAAEQPSVEDVVLRRASGAIEPPTVLMLSPQDAMKGEGAGTLISIEGEFLGVKGNEQSGELLFRSGGVVFSAVAPLVKDGKQEPKLVVGSRIRMTGIEIAEVDHQRHGEWTGEQHVSSIRVLLRSWDDVTVLERPSWWATREMFYVVCSGSLGILVVLCWVALLRRQVSQRTRELQASEERYRRLAQHDVLTGAPNRALFYERAEAMLVAARSGRRGLAVLLIDMDRFKPINDVLGHAAGDKVLCEVVERATAALGKGDIFARLGGDEFAVVIELGHGGESMKKAQRMMSCVCQPLHLEEGMVAISASMGAAVYPEDGLTIGELLRKADEAMYRSKQKGSGSVERFGQTPAMNDDQSSYADMVEQEAHMV